MSDRAGASAPSAFLLEIDGILHRMGHWLPTQGPIKDFIHHNTLHAFQERPFHEGVAAGARVHGARMAMPPSFYLHAYRHGRITEPALTRALEAAFPDQGARDSARTRLLQGEVTYPEFAGLAAGGLRQAWDEPLGGVPLHRRSHLYLFRLIGGYLDQGLSIWRMPGADRLGLWECIQGLIRESSLPVLPFDSPAARALVELPAREALLKALERVVGREDLYESYLLQTFLTTPGWSGMVSECERNPSQLMSRRSVSLLDLATVIMVAELGCLERELGSDFPPLAASRPQAVAGFNPQQRPVRSEDEVLLSVWQESFEWSYCEPLLGALQVNAERAPARSAAPIWAFFCIDDRSCSVRRHIEELTHEVGTFGTAGFFGLDFMYRGSGDSIAGKHCPAPMTPGHLILEELAEQDAARQPPVRWWQRLLHLEEHSNTFFRGWFLSYALGFGAALRLATSVLKPSLRPAAVAPLSTVNAGARFRLIRQNDERTAEGLLLGFTPDELADRIASVLRSCGTDRDWPELVVLFGHGASSVNNPYFAAYNCGACSGRTGAPNARAFAKAANRADVRAALRARGLVIPEGIWFVGCVLDTTRDEVTWYDLQRVPEALRARLDRFREMMDVALANNAAERCRRFETVPLGIEPARALESVRQRAVSLFEPRPEYNHATNAACVVGRRSLTRGLFLDRRAFLNSYDPTRDPDGQLLGQVLSAAVPVCAGINLEYFFSRIDPRVYGANTKLPHNINGLLGVCNGVESDLLTGLPTQMTEIHDPMRLLVIVEQTPEVALEAARSNSHVFELVVNEWVRYACVHPTTRQISMYFGGRWQELDGLRPPTWTWASSLEAARQGRGNLPVGFISRAASSSGERAT